MPHCPTCGADVAEGDAYCQACGAELAGGTAQPSSGGVGSGRGDRRAGGAAGGAVGGSAGGPSRGDQPGMGPGPQSPTGQPGPNPGPRSGQSETSRRQYLRYGAGIAVLAGGGWFAYDTFLSGPGAEAAREVIMEQLEAYRNENIDGVEATLHPDSPIYANTVEQSRRLFSEYDLSYEVTIRSVEVDGDVARVGFEQVTRKESGPAFDDNRIVGTHVLRTYRGEWRVYNTQVLETEQLP